MKCEHKGCERSLLIDCMNPCNEDQDNSSPIISPSTVIVRYYCLYHSQQYGYCWHCGFYAGHEPNFHLGLLGLCTDCHREFAASK